MYKKGFTLIELLIVIAIIGIVAAIAIPNLLVALQKAKQKATMADMMTIGTAIESYITDNYSAPGGGMTTIVSLQGFLVPFHTNSLPHLDGWGNQLQYAAGAAGSSTEDVYSVISYGRGNVPGTMDILNSNYYVSAMADFMNDICYSSGNFTYGPKVK